MLLFLNHSVLVYYCTHVWISSKLVYILNKIVESWILSMTPAIEMDVERLWHCLWLHNYHSALCITWLSCSKFKQQRTNNRDIVVNYSFWRLLWILMNGGDWPPTFWVLGGRWQACTWSQMQVHMVGTILVFLATFAQNTCIIFVLTLWTISLINNINHNWIISSFWNK